MMDIKKCRKSNLSKNAVVACQGVEGAYSQMAVNALFKAPDIMYMRTFDGVFRAVDNRLCSYGVLPLENSTAGSVTDVYDLMKLHNFYIVRSVKVSVFHVLLAKEKIRIEELKEIYTHEQAARQCSKFFEQNTHIKINICTNTAVAAQFVAESDRTDIAAIASENCAELYKLKVSARNIQNSKNNYTRFICISKRCEIFNNADKISLMLTLEHKTGALHEVIKRFADLQLNLTKLESRPLEDTDFEFMFYFDVQGNMENEKIYNLLQWLEQNTRQFVFVGNYSEVKI